MRPGVYIKESDVSPLIPDYEILSPTNKIRRGDYNFKFGINGEDINAIMKDIDNRIKYLNDTEIIELVKIYKADYYNSLVFKVTEIKDNKVFININKEIKNDI